MKGSSASLASMLCMLLAGLRVADAGKDRLTVPTDDGFNFFLDRFDDARTNPYMVTFYSSGFKSIYKLNENGFVTDIKADNETYTITYTDSGDLDMITDSSARRNLNEETEEGSADMPTNMRNFPSLADDETHTLAYADNRDDVEVNSARAQRKLPHEVQEGSVDMPTYPWNTPTPAKRRLYGCEDCGLTWVTVCTKGVETVCNLEGYGNPLLSAGVASIEVFCNTLGSICSEQTASDVCDGGCDVECYPPMTITLEWTSASGLVGVEVPYLSLYVIEPGGQTAGNSYPETGTGTFISPTRFKRTYTMLPGLDPDSTKGTYVAFAEWVEGFAPISWTLSATDGRGRVLNTNEGQFSGDCGTTITSSSTISSSDHGTSRGTTNLMYIETFTYVDNGCE